MPGIHTRHEEGFSLLETLLVVALLSGIMLVLTIFLQDYMRREQMTGVAEYVEMVQRAVDESVDSIDQFDALYALAQANGNVAEISILDPNNPNRTLNTLPTGNVSLEKGGSGLTPNNIVNAGYDPAAASNDSEFRDTLPIHALHYVTGMDGAADNGHQDVRLTIVVKIVDDPAITTDERALEILVASVDRLSEKDLRDIAQQMDASGGIVSAIPDTDASRCNAAGCQLTARSAYGNWYSDLPGFSGTNWYNRILTANPASENDGGYLVSYKYANEEMLAGDYLYRKAVPGNPSLNQMNTTLDLGGNNLVGADNVEVRGPAGSPDAALVVGQSIYAQGSVFVQNDLQVKGDMIVNGDLGASTLSVVPGYDTANPNIISGEHGNVVVEDAFTTGSMQAGGDVYADSARLAGMQAGQVSANAINVTNNLTITQPEGLFTGQLGTNSATVSGLARTGGLNASTVTTGSLGVVEGDMDGNLSVTGQRVTAGKVSTVGTLNINNVTQCLRGC